MFAYDIKFDNSIVNLKLIGKIEKKNELNDFRTAINTIYKYNVEMVNVDLSELNFLTSEALGVLLLFKKELKRKNCKIMITDTNEDIMTLFRATRVDKVFGIYD